ncbi:ABC transporter permease [Desulfocurvibacter africanus]|uniref:ABC3 transporter permease protein domain-containing protein n=1 Tax=Desulfocurvibacter africanus subsp. africanus str. Walvis Bay TaxID=690850 RepID=F3Z018_DESAF|nr:ABC transporter permease [Desulfocurvibacter africanus]EGJ52047.1 protein of unknown function DUF214 [Desulfocurvibacter africanus subsp. africanus str. Walvis Bay]
MRLLLFYSLRNLLARRMTTVLTAGGMALVVFVFAAMLMLAAGLEQTLVDTGSIENAVVLRRSSETEVQSSIERREAAIAEVQPEVALGDDGRPLAARESVVLFTLEKRNGSPANVTIRGIDEPSLALRPQVRLVAGRPLRFGAQEVMVGDKVAGSYASAGLGDSLRLAQRDWRVVGVFDAGNTAFSSEIWGDADQLMQAFRRQAYSVVVLGLRDPAGLDALKARLEADPRLQVEVLREDVYYREQSEMMATFLRILGIALTAIFSTGAVVGAMITMYAAVANRVGEIGTLRALGFGRGIILTAFLLESVFLGLLGGLVGLLAASLLTVIDVSTTNFQTFSELAFSFTLGLDTILQALGFSVFMGFVGGALPAYRAARMEILTALREA